MQERSCGTVLYTVKNGEIHYLLIQAKDDGYCGFPKGHVEGEESETQTALRETWEETSIRPRMLFGFREQVSYRMPNGNDKTVVYFLADFGDQLPAHNEGFEQLHYLILPFRQAYEMLTYRNTKEILRRADAYIRKYGV